jgi:hypothetical protein
MTSKRPSPLDPGAYGKAQRWHRILTDGARARAEKREEQRRRNMEAAQNSGLSSMTIFGALASWANLFR